MKPMEVNNFRKHLKIYWQLIKFAAIRDMTYRLNFFLEWLVEFGYVLTGLISLRIIFVNISEVAGWNFHQMLILIGLGTVFSETILGLFFIFNLRKLPEKITRGELDLILTKPLNSQFVVSMWRPYFTFIPSLIPGLILIYLGFTGGGYGFDPWLFLPFLTIFLSGLVIAYSVGMIITTLSVWLINATPLPELAEHLLFLAERPHSIFKGPFRIFFILVLPIAFMVSFPTQTLMGDFIWWWVPAALALAAVFLKTSALFWRLALKHYQSASS
ncbi:MAG: ABC-2 family transporter protein [Candidatus Pacebacteria bacterium]|nr:ABC-2 family transporter protein [Candidatus Paceibacterota bacterium]